MSEEKNKQGDSGNRPQPGANRPTKESYIGENVRNQEEIRKGAEIPPRRPGPPKK